MKVCKMHPFEILMLVFLSDTFSFNSCSPVTFDTKLGNITGLKSDINGVQVARFLGIPYAKPPVGELRFAKPVAVDHSFLNDGFNFNASTLPNMCPQMVGPLPMGDEDCLTLNIYTPYPHSSQPKQVMIYIHGGGFRSGAGILTPSDALVARGNIVVATINYRLNILGFLTTAGPPIPGNLGLYDQRMAIAWVKDNINDYGGDPTRITLFGESAGGRSTSYQMMSPLNDASLFQRVITESGSALSLPYLNRDPWEVTNNVTDAAGCPRGDNLLNCLRTKTTVELLKATQASSRPFSWFPVAGEDFLPHDLGYSYDDFVVNGTTDRLKGMLGNMDKYDLLSGWNDQDGLYYLGTYLNPIAIGLTGINISDGTTEAAFKMALNQYPFWSYPAGDLNNPLSDLYRLFYETNPGPQISDGRSVGERRLEWYYDIAGDIVLKLPSLQLLHLHNAVSSKNTYGYEFTHRRSWYEAWYEGPDWLRVGADHVDEIPMVFGYPFLTQALMNKSETDQLASMPELAIPEVRQYITQTYTDEEAKLAEDMMDHWIAFAKTGSPAIQSADRTWPLFDNGNGQKIAVIRTSQNDIQEYPMKERLQLWNSVSAAYQNYPETKPNREHQCTNGINLIHNTTPFFIGALCLVIVKFCV